MNLSFLFSLLLFFAPAKKEDVPASIYDIQVPALKGGDIDLSAYKGKKMLIVNTPCMTPDDPQYAALQQLSSRYAGKLVVIGVLADNFDLAPGTKIRGYDYHKTHYKVSFPLGDKVSVRGETMAPVFKWLTMKKYNNMKDNNVKWNFQKYLVDENGNLVAVFDPKVKPMSQEVIAAVEK